MEKGGRAGFFTCTIHITILFVQKGNEVIGVLAHIVSCCFSKIEIRALI